jgi:hypothetical protein
MRGYLRPLLLALAAALLLVLAVPRYVAGLAVDATFPVPAGIASNRIFSPQVYRKTAALLSEAAKGDGEAQITRAQALWLSGADPATVLPIAELGITHSPTSIQGWTLLAEILPGRDPAGAAKALSLALELSPYDYWLVGRKTRAGAALWNELAPDARAQVITQARLLWTQPEMRPQILPLLKAQGGAALMTRAIADPDEIRALNRYAARMRLGLP